jgi:hypothetical protein
LALCLETVDVCKACRGNLAGLGQYVFLMTMRFYVRIGCQAGIE